DGTGWVSKKSGAQLGADNGLTVGYNSTGNVGLGGTLSKNTEVATAGKTLGFSGLGFVGVGTISPRSKLALSNDGGGNLGADDISIYSYGSSVAPSVVQMSSGGTEAAPANIANGTSIGYLGFGGRWNNVWNYNTSNIKANYKGDGTTTLSDLVFATTSTNRMLIDENGNVGIGTMAPSAKLDLQGNQYINAAVTLAASKNAIDINVGQDSYAYGNRTENFGINMKSNVNLPSAGQIARINFGDVSTGGLAGVKYLSFSVGKTLNELMYLTDSNSGMVGIGTTSPGVKLEVNNGTTAGAIKIVDGTQGANKILTSDANGVGTWQTPADINIPAPAVFSLQSDIFNFLNGVSAGSSQSVPMAQIANNTNGNVTFNSGTNTVSLKPGVYQMTFVYEGNHNATGCDLSSYIVDFPTGTGSTTKRIHSTAAHNQGGLSNHGGTISFTTVITGTGYDWQIRLGRGQSGNCTGTGNTLGAGSTQLTVLRY
ncbi:hypothetical protein CLV58_1641, partial [Spirosoma oryzae]